MSYNLDFFYDKVNFKESQSRRFDAYPDRTKKLLVRLDKLVSVIA